MSWFPSRRQVSEESLSATGLKVVVLGLATALYLRELASWPALVTALVALVVAAVVARVAWRARVRLPVMLLAAGALVGSAGALEGWLLNTTIGPGPRTTLFLADSVYFGMLALGGFLATRSLVLRYGVFSVIEAAYVVGAATWTFIAHREQQIARPRWLTDWAWSQGIDPQAILHGAGVVAMVLAALVLVRRPDWRKLLASLVALLLLAAAVYELSKAVRIEPDIETNLDLTSNEQDDKDAEDDEDDEDDSGGSGGGSGEESESDEGGGGGQAGQDGDAFDAPNQAPQIVHPVAVANFHDEWSADGQIMYFRQLVLSEYNGNHLVAAPRSRVTELGIDADVIVDFPRDETLSADTLQHEDFGSAISASMYLLADHPQPLALTASVAVEPLDNPNPRRFAATYRALSLRPEVDYRRFLGRRSIPADWSPRWRAHYTAVPDDPRYAALADIIVRDIDPRLAGDDIARALAIKRYLEKEAVYTLSENQRHASATDPAASFLFGSMRGWCVHFAHAAVFLLRTQGIAARVALGYAVDPRMHGSGSSVMILSDRAHAWPEIHIEGVGWVPFDLYPEESEVPPPRYVDQSLESLLGELARGDETGGLSADPDAEGFSVPWLLLAKIALGALLALLALAYAMKLGRWLAGRVATGPRATRHLARATLDRFSDVGLLRHDGETREAFAARLTAVSPTLPAWTRDVLRHTLGGRPLDDPQQLDALRQRTHTVTRELADSLPWWQRALGWLNPLGWFFTK